jgi:hypothetical protein
MGYTHYFEQIGQAPTDQQWEQIVAETQQILHKYKKIVCFEDDQPDLPPQVDERIIRFNGKNGLGYETFFLDRFQRGFEFCKTARKPYDAPVVEVLKVVKKIAPTWLKLSSDGDVFD